jgi:hypothetical protein
MPIGAETLPVLPRPARYPSLQDAHCFFATIELVRQLVREVEEADPKAWRGIALAAALRHLERAASALKPLAGLGGDEAA